MEGPFHCHAANGPVQKDKKINALMTNVEFEWICYGYVTSRQNHSVFDDIGQYINCNETPFMSLK